MAKGRPLEVERELLEAFRHNGLITEYLVAVLPADLWRTPPPGGRGRSMAAIVAHIQSVRRTFARLGWRPARPAVARSQPVDAAPGTARPASIHRGSRAAVRGSD